MKCRIVMEQALPSKDAGAWVDRRQPVQADNALVRNAGRPSSMLLEFHATNSSVQNAVQRWSEGRDECVRGGRRNAGSGNDQDQGRSPERGQNRIGSISWVFANKE